MKSTVYIESTIPSYYVARPGRDIISLAHQEITRIWWEEHREKYDIYISQLVLEECSRGDKNISEKRVNLIKDIPVIIFNNDIISIVNMIISKKIIPETGILQLLLRI